MSGSLWTASGTLLASATFTNETASGWQQVVFSSPVAITAGTIYVAGYFAPNGHYSDTAPGFSTAVDSPPLHAVANTIEPRRRLRVQPAQHFPTNTFNATNYFVDVIFAATPPAAPGQVTGVSATAGTGSATVRWIGPDVGRRSYQLHGHAVHRLDGADGQDGDGLAASDDHDHLLG